MKRAGVLVGALVAISIAAAACDDSSSSGGGNAAFDAGSFDAGAVQPPPGTPPTPPPGPTDAGADSGDGGDGGAFVFGPNDRAVDAANGLDTNAGTLASPYKTLTKALAGRPAGASVVLLDGTYDTTTQGGTAITVPDGVTVRAQNHSGATLADIKLTLAGGATLLDLVLDKYTQVTATTGATTLTGVQFRSTNDPGTLQGTLMLGGTAQVTVTPGTLPGGVATLGSGALGSIGVLTGTAKLVMQGGIYDGNNVATGATPLIVEQGAELVVDGVTFRNLGLVAGNGSCAGILSFGTSTAVPAKVTVQNGATFDNVKAPSGNFHCPPLKIGSDSVVLVDKATFTNGGAQAIQAAAGAQDVSVTVQNGTTFTGNPGAIDLSFGGGTNTLTIAKATITNNTNGGNSPALRVNFGATNNVDISQLTMTNNTNGAVFYPNNLKIRTSTFTGNSYYGVQVYGTPASVDLGTAVSAGGNTIQNNTTGNLYGLTGGVIDAVGNTWAASIQGTDAAGHFANATQLSGPQTGTNFTINAGSTLNL